MVGKKGKRGVIPLCSKFQSLDRVNLSVGVTPSSRFDTYQAPQHRVKKTDANAAAVNIVLERECALIEKVNPLQY